MIVHLTRLASIGNVKILVLDYVEQTPTAELGIIFQFVFATEDSMVIHFQDVTELQVSLCHSNLNLYSLKGQVTFLKLCQ